MDTAVFGVALGVQITGLEVLPDSDKVAYVLPLLDLSGISLRTSDAELPCRGSGLDEKAVWPARLSVILPQGSLVGGAKAAFWDLLASNLLPWVL